MRLLIFALLQLLVFLPIVSFAADSIKTPATQKIQKAGIAETYGKLPLYFIENKGQVDKAVKFYEKGAGHATFFTEEGVVLALTKSNGKLKDTNTDKNRKHTTEAVKLSFIDANNGVKITSSTPLPGHVNYFIGNDKTRWQSNIPTYKAVTYENVYKNIDIKFYGNNRDIEHDIIVRPGGDPSLVKFTYEGIKGLKIRDNGDLEVSLNYGKVIEKRPIIYQVINGERKNIEGSYSIFKGKMGAFTYGYTVASYDHTKKLVIDPVLVYSTYLGGSNWDGGKDIAVDNTGAVYVTGVTGSLDFPLVSPAQFSYGGGNTDGFITKINPAGTAIIYSTYFGGMGNETNKAIAVDSNGAVFIAGDTGSQINFPLVNPIQDTFGGSLYDAFLVKLNPAGSAIIFSTYLGGSGIDSGDGLALDNSGAAYVTGSTSSPDFPTVNPIQIRSADYNNYAFVTKINPTGSAIVYSTCIGGSGNDFGKAIDVDSSGAAYLTGIAYSTDFPLVNPLQPIKGGGSFDAFVTKINPAGSAYVYSTYVGGSSAEWSNSIAVDSSGAAYITGEVLSADFPTVNPIQGYSGYDDAFITKINPAGSAIVYSTYLGGTSGDKYFDITVDNSGAAYVTGWSSSANDYPLVAPLQGIYGGGASDITVAKLNPAGSELVFSTFFGGSGNEPGRAIAVDSSGAIYITGETSSSNLPIANAIQGRIAGNQDAFISKITLPAVTLTINIGAISVAKGSTLAYDVLATNTTATRQCFQYWENLNLPGGTPYPARGELFGPIRLCLNAGASQTVRLTHGVPLTAPVGSYALNAFIGAYAFPVLPVVVSEAHFTFDVTAFNPATTTPQTSWLLIENGLK